jgi:hypothetical protein
MLDATRVFVINFNRGVTGMTVSGYILYISAHLCFWVGESLVYSSTFVRQKLSFENSGKALILFCVLYSFVASIIRFGYLSMRICASLSVLSGFWTTASSGAN